MRGNVQGKGVKKGRCAFIKMQQRPGGDAGVDDILAVVAGIVPASRRADEGVRWAQGGGRRSMDAHRGIRVPGCSRPRARPRCQQGIGRAVVPKGLDAAAGNLQERIGADVHNARQFASHLQAVAPWGLEGAEVNQGACVVGIAPAEGACQGTSPNDLRCGGIDQASAISLVQRNGDLDLIRRIAHLIDADAFGGLSPKQRWRDGQSAGKKWSIEHVVIPPLQVQMDGNALWSQSKAAWFNSAGMEMLVPLLGKKLQFADLPVLQTLIYQGFSRSD